MSELLILETNELVKEFKGFIAVNGVNLGVRQGQIHALIGPNGAGKTVRLQMV
jgi:branched-chain amino acid transport system ATP-binding protein